MATLKGGRSNGFIYWAALNCYVHWHQDFDAELLEDYRYVFTHARNYKGTTSNLSMIHTLADNIWGADSLPKDGKFGPRGDKAIKWLTERVERIAKRGSGEFASRPYMIFNVGTLLTLDNDFVPAELRKKAAMAYEMSIAHGAATWLRGHWAVPSGRSYPDQLTQQPLRWRQAISNHFHEQNVRRLQHRRVARQQRVGPDLSLWRDVGRA